MHTQETKQSMRPESDVSTKQPYQAPAIIFETELEVRAGTPLGIPDPSDLLGTGQ